MATKIQTLDEGLARRADAELRSKIIEDLHGFEKWANQVGSVEVAGEIAKNWSVTIDGEQIGTRIVKFSPRLMTILLENAAFAQARDNNRAEAIKQFLAKFDELQQSVEYLQNGPRD